MDQPRTRWVISPPAPPEVCRAAPGLHPVVAHILYHRGVLLPGTTSEEVERFLTPRWGDGLHDPFLMADMEPAVERILYAIDQGEPIGVYGHYDADGITAMALLIQVIHRLGGWPLPYLPARSDEYGVNETGIATLARQGARLLVSVDCGIRSFTAPEVAARYGIDVIITDHHTVLRQDGRDVLPQALAVLNPMRADCPYPCKALAGVGVTFKLAQALLQAHARRNGDSETYYARWLLDLVCLGTVADMVDLLDENRALVHLGLQVLRQQKRTGLRALLRGAGTRVDRLTAEAVAYQLAPRINAAARIDTPQKSLDLLQAATDAEAGRLVEELNGFNRQRQRETEAALNDVRTRYGDTLARHNAIVVTGEWKPGIIGLVAAKLVEEYHRPAVAIETGSGAEAHGSARSIPEFHIAGALERCADLLTRYGGHAQAAGFSLLAANVDAFRERLQALADASIPPEALERTLTIDAVLEPSQVDQRLFEAIQSLQPFGPGNPEPVFAFQDARISSVRAFGENGSHLRLDVDAGSGTLAAKCWRMGGLAASIAPGTRVDVAFTLQDGFGNGGVELRVEDLVVAGE